MKIGFVVLSYLYPETLVKGFKYMLNCVKSEKLKRKLKEAGSGFYIKGDPFVKGAAHIRIGDSFKARDGLRIEAIDSYKEEHYHPEIQIGNDASLGSDCHLGAIDKIVIGDHFLAGNRLYISDHNHGRMDGSEKKIPPLERKLYSKGPVMIGDNVWVGDGVAILPGVTIGNNVVIGASSVVTKDVPSDSVAAGVPAKVVKTM